MKKCLDPELHEMRPCDCPGRETITEKMRLDRVLKFLNADPVLSNNGRRKWTRRTFDAVIRAERRGKL